MVRKGYSPIAKPGLPASRNLPLSRGQLLSVLTVELGEAVEVVYQTHIVALLLVCQQQTSPRVDRVDEFTMMIVELIKTDHMMALGYSLIPCHRVILCSFSVADLAF